MCGSGIFPQLALAATIASQWRVHRKKGKRGSMAKAKGPIPDGYYSVTPQLTLDNASKSIDWYKKALGAKEISRFEGPDGKVMHAELQIGNSRFMVNDVLMGKGPKAYGGSPASLWIYTPDVDALYNQAIAA